MESDVAVITRWLPFGSIVCCLFAVTAPAQPGLSATEADIVVDFGRPAGVIRPLHGINKGPLAAGGLIDVTARLQALKPPFARLHDCHWPNPDVVDIHAVFPDLKANPELPSSYDFALTDEYISATRQTGAQIIYRLGESIEHTSARHYTHPPHDYQKWAAICLGIIRHYNEGWARGFHHGIRYWEIWNEPENRPAMWSGSDENYFRLYGVAASAIKTRYPQLKVGGPAVGYSGELAKGHFRPGTFVTNFLAFCRRESLPLDFFSWHCYTADPAEPVARTRAIRHLLDDYGFTNSESHLNEWNFLPGNTWKPISRSSPPEARQSFYEQMAGPPGAAFIIAILIELQDAPIDVCNLFHGELGGFGLFNEHGVPQKNYQALQAFAAFLETPRRVEARCNMQGRLAVAAGLDGTGARASILVSNFDRSRSSLRLAAINIPWTHQTIIETRLVNGTENFGNALRQTNVTANLTLLLESKGPEVMLLQLQPDVN
jgi:hypothetical protein